MGEKCLCVYSDMQKAVWFYLSALKLVDPDILGREKKKKSLIHRYFFKAENNFLVAPPPTGRR